MANFIFGLPDDSIKSMQETLDLAIDLNCEMANFYSAMAYPGSLLYTQALKSNRQLPESWIGYSQHSYETLPLSTKYLSASEVLSFRDNAFKKYFNREQYRTKIKKQFGMKTLNHIENMMKHTLRRKYLA